MTTRNRSAIDTHSLLTTQSWQTSSLVGKPEDALTSLMPLAERLGVRCDLATFHNAVNLAFHAAESKVYDEAHSCMWKSLPAQFKLLATECDRVDALAHKHLRLLDVGCGTGLSAELLLRTPIGKNIQHVSLVDTSAEMLDLARQRVTRLGWRPTTFLGELSAIPVGAAHDIILACSVLHHIPDIPGFLRDVAARQGPGGIFLHLQDPNADRKASTEAQFLSKRLRRMSCKAALRTLVGNICPPAVIQFVRHLARRVPKYIDETNSTLIRQAIISKPMTAADLWSVTDIHVHDGAGISLRSLQSHLEPAGYHLVDSRTYGFFGALQSELAPALAIEEQRLIEAHAPGGSELSGAWVRTGVRAQK